MLSTFSPIVGDLENEPTRAEQRRHHNAEVRVVFGAPFRNRKAGHRQRERKIERCVHGLKSAYTAGRVTTIAPEPASLSVSLMT